MLVQSKHHREVHRDSKDYAACGPAVADAVIRGRYVKLEKPLTTTL